LEYHLCEFLVRFQVGKDVLKQQQNAFAELGFEIPLCVSASYLGELAPSIADDLVEELVHLGHSKFG
jgi:hypothetical protein